jgi:predicted RNase H-like nuclease (RuvC/YqgF family)
MSMNAKKIPISIKVNTDLFDKIEKERGDTGRAPFIEEILKKYFFDETYSQRNIPEYQKMLRHLENENTFLRERIERMETLILQLQSKIPMAIEKPKRRFWDIFRR